MYSTGNDGEEEAERPVFLLWYDTHRVSRGGGGDGGAVAGEARKEVARLLVQRRSDTDSQIGFGTIQWNDFTTFSIDI